MRFVKVIGEGVVYYVNPGLVRTVTPSSEGATLRFDDDHSVAVDERADDIVKKFDKAL
jgi:hypothetical protein